MNSDFVTKIKFHIKNTLRVLKTLEKGITDFQVRWEFLNNKIRKFVIEFSQPQAQNTKKIKSVFRK